jgi:hypothetical protein
MGGASKGTGGKPDAADCSAELLAAVTALGGGLNGVALQACDGMGLGMVATRALTAGDWVWRVPAAAMLTTEAALVSPVGLAIAAACEVRDAAASDSDEEQEAGAWQSEWAAKEQRWTQEEAAEAAARSAKRSRVSRRAEQEEEEEEEEAEPSSSSSEGCDEASPEPPARRIRSRSVLYAYLVAAREPGSTLPHAAYARSLPASFNCPLLWTEVRV